MRSGLRFTIPYEFSLFILTALFCGTTINLVSLRIDHKDALMAFFKNKKRKRFRTQFAAAVFTLCFSVAIPNKVICV